MKKIGILGSTGSVGTQTLDIIKRFKNNFEVIILAASKLSDKLEKQIKEFKPKYVYVENIDKDINIPDVEILTGKEGIDFYSSLDIDLFINGISGLAGIYPTYKILKKQKKLATANKEAIICLGEILRDYYEDIIPLDSEHSSIYQTIKNLKKEEISKIILTSSGGPFLYRKKNELENVTIEEALNHPRWKMGKKISIDSATLMNKGLEVIEAHYLFGFDYSNIEVIIHPQSVIHSIVKLIDGSMFANISPTDMRYPISYALFYPDRVDIGIKKLNLVEIGKFEFFKPDIEKFPLLDIALKYGKMGGYFPIVLTAADEIVVKSFLEGKIKFIEIPKLIQKALETAQFKNPENIDDVFFIIKKTQDIVEKLLEE